LPDEGGFDFLGDLPPEEIQITTNPSNQLNLAIHENKVVYQDNRNGNWDIYMVDLETRAEKRVTLSTADEANSHIYGGKIVWDDGNWIYMCDLEKNGQEGGCLEDDGKMIVSKGRGTGIEINLEPFIHKDIIVWKSHSFGNFDYLYYCNLSKNGLSGGCLEGDSKITVDWGIYWGIYENYENPFVYENKIVWQQIENHKVNYIWIKAWEIYLCGVGRNGQQGGCLNRDAKIKITSNPFDQMNPSIYGNKIVWQDNRNGNWDIQGIDLSFLSEGKSENCETPGDEDWSGLSDCADPVCEEGIYCNREHTKICNVGVCTLPNEIRKCTTLTESGEYYLGKDLGEDELVSDNCINIQAEEVVFDCKGKLIRGLGKTLIFSEADNVVIKNCNLEAVDGTAIKIEADNNLIENVNISNSKLGIEVNGEYIALQNNKLENNFKGASIIGDSAFVNTNTIKNNLEEGLIVEGSYGKISNNNIINNNKGIVLNDASHTRLRCNNVFDNVEYDLELKGISREVVSIGDFEKKKIGWFPWPCEFNVIEGSCEEIGASAKNMEKYSGKEAFLVSNKDWKQVLQLVPLSVWTGNEECQRGTQTPENVCVYPSLIYHEEGYAFDENPPDFDEEFYEIEIGGEYWQEFIAQEKYLEKITISSLTQNSNLIKIFVDVRDLDGNLIASSELMEFNTGSIYFEFPIYAELAKGQKYRFYINLLEHSGGIFWEEWPDWNKPLYYSRGADYPEGSSNLEVHDLAFTMQYEKDIEDNFDADSIIYFLQQYSPNRVTIVGESPEEVDNLLVAEPEFGAGLEEAQIQRINLENYLSYWQEIGQIVYVEDDYEEALLASTYASLINSPLIIEGTELDDLEDCGAETCIFDNQNVILVGNVPCPKTAFYCEMYSLEKLQEKYIELTGTTKTILVNPQDLEIKKLFREGFSTKTSEINGLFTKTSLAAPFLASAKHEILLSVNKQDYASVNSFFKGKLNSLGLSPEYLTVVATPNAISYRSSSASVAADTTVYANLDSDASPELAVGRIMGLTTSDVSSYIARALSYNELEKTENVKFIAGGLTWHETENRPLKAADFLAEKFDIGYNSKCSINVADDRYDLYECKQGYEPSDWIDQSFIAWIDHGQVNAAGIQFAEIPNLKNSLMFSKACATCALENSYDHESFCMHAIRKGAIAYVGNIAGSWSGDWKVADFLNGVYYYDLAVGHALKNGLEESGGYWTILVGDPTLKIDVPYKLDVPMGTGRDLEWW